MWLPELTLLTGRVVFGGPRGGRAWISCADRRVHVRLFPSPLLPAVSLVDTTLGTRQCVNEREKI